MTTLPAKHHQRLHNFSLPFLKWGQRIQTNNHCRRRDRHTRTDSDTGRKPHRSRDRATEVTEPNNNIDEQNNDVFVENLTDVDVVTAVDGDVKPWNLRPRRLAIGGSDGNGLVSGVCGAKSGRLLRGCPVAGAAPAATAEENDDQRMKKQRLWVSLSKEEIEEDIYAFTGSKPARRPKKRSKIAQKQVDNCFPGLYLAGLSADSYRV
ncbi:uncharacterized protein [Rutidosis leptorrhynchoides]|uniref:uncharacterized protein n=1 Tax=Rutidosis leptorrhynchoides TaxID=125765 RepID=UPI003A990D8B